MATKELIIRLHKPHEQQRKFRESKAKRKIICAGRRGGKTTGIADMAVEEMLKGRRILEAAPTADQTSAFWKVCKDALAEPIAAGYIYKNETERLLEVPNGGRIRTKTAYDADTLRGDYADLLILDEFSIMKPDTWGEVGAPMLLDNNGDAVFIFTPKRKNHAHSMYVRALGDTSGRWEAFHYTSHDNPYLSAEALAEITSDMTEDAYQQEIMAMFLENEGAVFRNIGACVNAPMSEPHAHAGHTIVAGCDWAKQQDYTCFSFGCMDCRVEVERDRFNQIDYSVQRQRLQVMTERWQPAIIMTELNSIGQPVFEELQRVGLPVVGFTTTASTKPPLIENLALTLERAEWQFQNDPIWTGELEAYERKVSPATGRSQYNAPEGVHDDTVIARALMLWSANNQPGMDFA